MVPRALKICWYPRSNLGSLIGRRRKQLVGEDADHGAQCLMGARESSCDHTCAIYVKDGLGEWALMQPPPSLPVDAVIDFDELRRSMGASQAEVRRRMREPMNQSGKGVWFVDNVVPTYLRHVIMTRLDAIAGEPKKDFRPDTDHMVQDLIRPSLEGLSNAKVLPGKVLPKVRHHNSRRAHTLERESERQDLKYHQCLPSQFYVSSKGSVQIKSYINNLDESTNTDLYMGTELLFQLFLPMFERILPDKQLRDRELQVIVKAVNYVIQPKGHMYEGVWHAEGLTHEHIVATGLYYYSTSPWLKDGGLEFRPYEIKLEQNPTSETDPTVEDLDCQTFENGDGRRSSESRLASLRRKEGLRVRCMVGSVPTIENRLLVFPNHLQHKVSGIVNDSENQVGFTKTFIFLVVNPDINVVSTRDVYEQEWDRLRSLQRDALNEAAQRMIGRCFPAEILDEITRRGTTMADHRRPR